MMISLLLTLQQNETFMILELNDCMHNFLPALVIGFEPNDDSNSLEDRIREFEVFPSWFISIFAQVGSTRCIEYRQQYIHKTWDRRDYDAYGVLMFLIG